jgi:hypothetical protein
MNDRVCSGKYKSPHDFIITAIQNQIYLESREVVQGSTFPTSSAAEPKSLRIDPELAILLLPPDIAKVKTVALSEIERPNYLWGQYNRFFPVKIAVRVAANLIGRHESGYVSLGEVQEISAEAARLVGKESEKMDRKYGRKRGTIIAAGLPIGRDADKAKFRFKNQFVGHMISKIENDTTVNRIYGAAPALKFLDMKKGERNSVQLGVTDFGLKFSSLPNPVIDQHDFSTALSGEEAEFLLDHIASHVPEEARLMRLILAAVRDGIATPSELNAQVQAQRSDWNDNEAAMMRAGIVSRIGELRLLERRKQGVKVTYLLTGLGEKYLEKLTRLEI